jgi:hypothetical protein
MSGKPLTPEERAAALFLALSRGPSPENTFRLICRALCAERAAGIREGADHIEMCPDDHAETTGRYLRLRAEGVERGD